MSQSATQASRTYVHIDLDERRLIDHMNQRGRPVDEIAAATGRHRSTIYRELKRNTFIDDEWSDLNGYYDRPPVWWRRLGRHSFHGGG